MTDAAKPTCARHPKVVSYLRCASCNTPICPRCYVETPVGYKCRACGTWKHSALYKPTVLQALATFAVGLLGGMIGAPLFAVLGCFGFFLAVPYGRLLGTFILRASGRKISILIDVITVCSIALGGLGMQGATAWYVFTHARRETLRAAHLAMAAAHAPQAHAAAAAATQRLLSHYPEYEYLLMFAINPFSIICLVIIAACAISRIRWSWNYWGI